MADHSSWDEVKDLRRAPTDEVRIEVGHDLALG
jgi:hypothetical protein